MRQFGHQLATLVSGTHVHVHAAHHVAARGVFGAQIVQAHDARRGTGAARFNAFANPDLFLRQQLVGLGADHRLLRQLLFLLQQVGGKVAGIGQQLATVQLDDAGGHVVQKGTVVGDGDDGALEIDQQALQPFDGIQVQMVGRLVEQQHVGLGHQRLGQCHALLGAARQGADNCIRVQVQALQGFIHPLLPVPAVQRFDLALHGVQVAMAQTVFLNQADNPLQT